MQWGRKSAVGKFLTPILIACIWPTVAAAGPPFQTDDPEPAAYRHWEIYVSSEYAHEGNQIDGSFPALDVNYGLFPNVQASIRTSMDFSQMATNRTSVTVGDTELGVKVRLMNEDKAGVEIAIYPKVLLPTIPPRRGDQDPNVPQTFLSAWAQKNLGDWTVYGGTGRWNKSASANVDWWLTGIVVERVISSHITLGGEVFHETAKSAENTGHVAFNVGVIERLDDHHGLLLSVGRDLHGGRTMTAYAAYQLTLGAQPGHR